MVVKISIGIPVVNGVHIKECLDSIFKNKFNDFEVIVNDSSPNFIASDIISQYDVKLIKKKTKNLESRFVTISGTNGEAILLFDETRIMSDNLLLKLDNMQNDMVVIGELDIGSNFITFINNLDKQSNLHIYNKLNPWINKSVIPRFYKSRIVKEAILKIRENLPDELFKEAVALDLELIYLESYNISNKIGIIPSVEILHYGERTFKDVFNKYYRYGYTQKILRNTYYKEYAGIGGRSRSNLSISSRIKSFPVIVIRGIPFIFGYIVGKY